MGTKKNNYTLLYLINVAYNRSNQLTIIIQLFCSSEYCLLELDPVIVHRTEKETKNSSTLVLRHQAYRIPVVAIQPGNNYLSFVYVATLSVWQS